MTGFAREAGVRGPHQWAWEIKTVNGRGLDIRLRTPPGFDDVGEAARREVAGQLARGQCQLTLSIVRSSSPPKVRINEAVLASLIDSLARVPRPAELAPATLDGLLGVRGVVEADDDVGAEAFDDGLKQDLVTAAGRLVDAVVSARAGEGAALAEVLLRHLTTMGRLTGEAERCPARQPEAVKGRLAAQVALLLDAHSLDPARLHQEAALLAARADIREELDRLLAHLAAARDLIGSGGPVGRRLDFLAQELGREINTLCAKSNDVELSRIGLELKAVAEQFREQVQNVE